MRKHLLSALSVFSLLTACSNRPEPVVQSPSQDQSLGQVHRTRVCDQPMAWQYKDSAHDVPDRYKSLIGLWTGEVDFTSGGSMCIAVAVAEVTPSGDVNAIFAWNLGGTSSSGEFLNTHSQGTANWWAKGIKVGPKDEEMVVFAAKDPFHGLMYEYRFSFPNNDKLIGSLIGSKRDGTTHSRDAAVLTRSTYPAPLVAAVGK